MRKFYLISIILSLSQGCSVYDLFSSITPHSALTNSKFVWVSDTTKDVIYHFEKGQYSQNDIKSIRTVTEESIKKNLQLIKEKEYSKVIEYFIVPTKERMNELTGYTYNAFSVPRLDVVFAIIGNDVRALGSHEFNHVIAENMWGPSEDWLEEGFAVFSDNDWHGNDLHSLNKYLFDKNKLLRISSLADDFNSYSTLITYPQSGSIVKYIYEKYGSDKFKLLWQNGIISIEKIYGKKLVEIEKEWLNEIQNYQTKEIKYSI